MYNIPLNIVLIGSGNLATQLGLKLHASNHKIIQVFSKTIANAIKLGSLLNATPTDNLRDLKDADLYIISVKDDILPDLIKNISLTGKVLIHTSGSVNLDVFNLSPNTVGVFYPLQSFSKLKTPNWEALPICIETSNKELEVLLCNLAISITAKPYLLDSQQRRAIHIAAVFASNFSNYMYTIANDILKDKDIPFEILRPLIMETTQKVMMNLPEEMQTGPAYRGDKSIINNHSNELAFNTNYQEIYNLISKAILDKYKI